jgi:hypothetical protein
MFITLVFCIFVMCSSQMYSSANEGKLSRGIAHPTNPVEDEVSSTTAPEIREPPSDVSTTTPEISGVPSEKAHSKIDPIEMWKANQKGKRNNSASPFLFLYTAAGNANKGFIGEGRNEQGNRYGEKEPETGVTSEKPIKDDERLFPYSKDYISGANNPE